MQHREHNRNSHEICFSISYGFFPLIYAARVTFAVASSDPHPLPGNVVAGWWCAGICFVTMMLVQNCIDSLVYVIPKLAGAEMEFYYLDLISWTVNGTVGVVITAMVIKHFAKGDHQQAGTVPTGQVESADNNNEGERKDGAPDSWAASISRNLRASILTLVIIGCE